MMARSMKTVLVMWRLVGITWGSMNLTKHTLDWMLMLASLMLGYRRISSILPRKLKSVFIWSLVAWGAMLVTWITLEVSNSMVMLITTLINFEFSKIDLQVTMAFNLIISMKSSHKWIMKIFFD